MYKYFTLFAIVFACSCKSEYIAPDSYQERKIIFGDGGGFSGYINHFCLLDNGNLYKKMHKDTGYIQITRLKSDQAQQLLNNWTGQGFDNLKVNKPGNMYQFIEFYNQGNKQRIVWDPYEVERYKELNKYYKLMRAIVQKEIKPNSK